MIGLPKKINDNIFNKFIRFIKILFQKKHKPIDIEKTIIKNNQGIENFKVELKKEINEKNKKEDLIKKIEENPDIIYDLPDARLKQLNLLYDKKLIELDNTILLLRNQLKNLQGN